MRIFILLFAALLISQINYAQNILKGSVTDKTNGEKLTAASVYISELNKGTSTDKNGTFIINGLSKGNYTVQISYLGYQTRIQKIKMNGSDVSLNIQLEKAALEVNEVVISGAYVTSQDESPQEIDVVKKSEMLQTGASTVMDIITKVPGVTAITTGPLVSRPVIRGLSGNRILTVVDGVRFETQQWDDEHGIGINELGMDRIEIIKGPATLLYGPEAMGGVVHFIEEQPAAIGHISGNIYGSLGSNNLGIKTAADIKGATEKYNWGFAALAKILPDYYYNAYNFRAPNTRMNELGVKGNVGINRKWGSSSLSYQFNQAYYGILDGKDIVKNPDGSISNKDTSEVDMFPSEVEAPYHSVTDHKISSKTTLLAGNSRFNIVLGYQNNHRTEYEDNGSKEGYNYVDIMLQSGTYDAKWYLPAFKNFSTIIGVMGMYQTNRNATEAKTQLVPDANINDIGIVAVTKYNLKRFNLTAGLRYDTRQLSTTGIIKDSTLNMPAITKSYNNISASIGATYDIEDHLLLRANFASGYRTPNLNELMSNGLKLESQHYEVGNINFVKEQNNELDVSAIFKTDNFSLEAAAYLNTINNYIYLAPTGNMVNSNLTSSVKVPEYKYYQVDAQIKGGEAGVDIHPTGLSWMHYEIKLSAMKATRTDNNSYLPMMPTTKIFNTLVCNLKEYKQFRNLYFRIGCITAMEQNNVAVNELSTPGYTLLNASLGLSRNVWKFHNVDFSLAVNNALDKIYMDNLSRLRPYGIANQGRNIVLSMKIPFDFDRSNRKN
ncbi:MAG: TonB-dependent receptor [Bacteroidetes bacterium]|nr:TonB-dependent receptor [Bacteroidota bacterium]